MRILVLTVSVINTAKLSCQDFEKLSPLQIRPIPWISTGYFYDEESRPARCRLLSGRTLLSPGTKCHDPCIQTSR
ncbi:MAG: hypothetical protein ACLU2Y_12930 [Blautia massiliensis (ex Durand et al. 2017)]|uniref:hypothetical protein n=1 Tax=Blautia massiliensis (ex Durand et al. 2017) TaxID=1737424 RepID=UPI00399C4B28